ncbi:MAG: M4 family metallopeptidase [Vicingaceae bacterium]
MKLLALWISLLFAFASLNAQTLLQGSEAEAKFEVAQKLFYKDDLDLPIYIELKESAELSETEFFRLLETEFGLESKLSFQFQSSSTDELGIEHKRYRQAVDGIPIYMAQFSLHLKQGKVLSASGKFYATIASQSIQLSEEQALNKALNDFKAEEYKWENQAAEQFLKRETQDIKATFYPQGEKVYFGQEASDLEKKQVLCWAFNVYAHEPLARRKYYINAFNGEVVFAENLIHHGNAQGSAQTAYSGQRQIVTDSLGAIFRLRETTRGNGIETYDMNNGTRYSNAVDFVDSNNVWDNFTPGINRYATDAHWGTEMTYDYFQQVHNRNSIDNQGFTLRSYVHYSSNYVNAFWDGQRMTYGDGDATTSPLTTLDITGHEIAHGFTNFSSQLIYASESGALNESFSDIFGVAVEQFARNSNWNWFMGEEIGSPFRSLSNPKSFGDPDTYGGGNWVNQNCFPTSGNDWCGVHTNSGVQNYWFYLLSEGRSGTNDKGQAYQVDSIGIIKAAKVAFRNNAIYLTASSDHQEARFFSILSAADIYGACSAEVEAVTDAWHAVGVGNAYVPGVSANFVAQNEVDFCNVPASVQFNSEGTNVLTFNWDFGDGSTSNLPDPIRSYSSFGQYTVRLIADGGACGTDTVSKTNYININSTNPCSFSLPSGKTTLADCQGVVYDGGGLNGDYNFSVSDTLVVNPPASAADQIRINFDFISIESGLGDFCINDYLEVYDGPSTAYPSLGRFCDTLNLSFLYTTSNAFTIVFKTDNKVNKAGFKLSWSCQSASTPQADFYSAVDTSCNGRVNFVNTTPTGYTSAFWDFGDGTFSNDRNPEHQYLQNGDYTVKLLIANSAGSDSITKQNVVHVSRPNSPTVVGDSICRDGNAKIWANGAPELLWYNDSTSNRAVHRGDTLNIPFLQNTVDYYVSTQPPVNSQTIVPFTISGSGYYTDTAEAIYFTVYNPTILESVLLKTNTPGQKTILLRDFQGRVLASHDVFISGAGVQASLNFELNPGQYSLSIGSRDAGLYVNSSGANLLSYQAPGLFEITGTSMGTSGTAYPFFYLLKVKPLRCESPRQRVVAFVDTNCVVTQLSDLSSETNQLEVFPNPFSNTLTIKGDLALADELRIYSMQGKLIERRTFNRTSSNTLDLEMQQLPAGIYFIELRGEAYSLRKKLLKINP